MSYWRQGVWVLGVLASSSVLTACAADESPQPVEPDPNTTVLETGVYELEPGQESYLCYTFELPEEGMAPVVKIEPEHGEGVHHLFFAYTLLPETEPSGFECDVLFKTSWIPLYLGGVDSGALELPGDAAFQFSSRQLVLQLHLQNTTPEPLRDTVKIRVTTAEEGANVTPAGIFGIDNRIIDLPPASTGVQTTMECEPKRDMDVFGVLGHMHKLGKSIAVSDVAKPQAEPLFQAEWDFDDQPIRPADFSLSTSDRLRLDCVHDNATQTRAVYGESSDTEMCSAVLYYTPFDYLDGCVVE